MSTTTPDVREKIERAPRDVEASRAVDRRDEKDRARLVSRSRFSIRAAFLAPCPSRRQSPSRGIRSSSQLTRAGCLVLASRSKYQDTTLVSTR
jgi:hypothetical protein